MSTMAHGVSPSTSSSCFGATVPTAPAEWLTSSSSSPPAGMQSRGAASPPCGAADCAASLATAAERSPDRSAPEAASLASCAAAVHRDHGPLGFFRGATMNFARLSATFIIGTSIYEQVRRIFGLGYFR